MGKFCRSCIIHFFVIDAYSEMNRDHLSLFIHTKTVFVVFYIRYYILLGQMIVWAVKIEHDIEIIINRGLT